MKKTLSLVFALIFLVSCASSSLDKSSQDDESTLESDVPAIGSTDSQITETAFSLYDATVDRLQKIEYKVKDGKRQIFLDNLGNTSVVSHNAVSFIPDYNNDIVRNSTRTLYVKDVDEDYGIGKLNDRILNEYFTYDKEFSTQYKFTYSSPVMIIKNLTEDRNGWVDEVLFGLSGNVRVNAFIRKCGTDVFEVIVDPAYMHGIPVFHSNAAHCKFNINGTEIEADTIEFYITDLNDYYSENYQDVGDEFVYAKMQVNLACFYSTKDGYISGAEYESRTGIRANKCWGQDLEILSKDVASVLANSPDFSLAAEKEKALSDSYNVITNNLSDIYNENTFGITLLDLDFDSAPELLVSRYADSSSAEYEHGVNVDIYRLNSDKLVYIDTLYCPYMVGDGGVGCVLGLKRREDGTRAWFNMSSKNRLTDSFDRVDYLFTLKNNKLNFTEVFREEKINETQSEYYYFGEKIVFGSYVSEYGPYEEEDWTVTTWNGLEAWFGEWEMYGFIRAQYCKDMRDSTYILYSDWLGSLPSYSPSETFSLTTREINFNIAYLVDAFYLGNYNPSKQSYVYEFLGAYAKPVIYLYPETKTDVSVSIDIDGELTCTYPEYNDGWNVTAYPDGTLINKKDGREYSYLYWEGVGKADWDLSKGFVVKGEDTAEFLQEKLEYLGLTPREYNEFIVYWLPLMQENKYNLITFQTDAYESSVKLNVSPTPDSVLRIFMVYKPLSEYISIPEQQLESFERTGFAVIEWGGGCLEG